ncbi:MAG: hypothetical protein ACI97A_003091 [Planctomycetota bacterium]|jgi:hypothetical protein
MSGEASIIHGLTMLGRPRRWRRFCATFVVLFDLLVLIAPIFAFFLRVEQGACESPFLTGLMIVGGVLALASLLALVRLLFEPRDPMVAAREVDQLGQTQEMFLTVADYVLKEKQSLFLPSLLERAEARLPSLATKKRPALRIPLFAFKRDVFAVILTVLVLMVPAFPKGLLGPKDKEQEAITAGADEANSNVAGEKPAETEILQFEGKVKVRVHSDKKLYFMGDEITLIVEVETLEPLPEGVMIGAVALVDGEANMPLPMPTGQMLPRLAGEKTVIRMKIRDRLKAIDRYRRGLLAIDPFIYAKTQEPGFDGPAPGNRIVLQIAENAEKLRAKTPTAVKKKKQEKKKPKPKPQPKKKDNEKKPKEQKKPEKKPRQAPGKQPGAKPPEKIEAKPFVVEPLFSGNKTKKRKVRVFDREKEKGATPPKAPTATGIKTRGYDEVEEAELKKLNLGNQERRLVRKYLDGIRNAAPQKKKK